MIKILFFIDKFSYNGSIGGAEKVLISLVNHLDSSKFDITVQTLFPDEYAKMLNPNIKYKYSYPKNNSLMYKVFRVEAQMGLTYYWHIKDKYDIEVAYLENETTKVLAASTNKRAKKIAWIHCDFKVAFGDDATYIAKVAKLYKKFDKIACVSEKCKESFISMFGNDPEVVVIHNVIDDKEILEKAEQPLPSIAEKRKLTLCTLGRFYPPKNYLRLLKTAYQLHEEGYDFDWWILGDGEQREMIEKYINEHHMETYIRLYGFQNNPYPFMKAADLLVCSSNYEGFSTFISEGLIIGKPILTTDCSGMKELLGESEYGMIVPNDDNAFYNGLKKMLSLSETELLCYAKRSIERGRTFSTDNLVRDTESFFLKTLSSTMT